MGLPDCAWSTRTPELRRQKWHNDWQYLCFKILITKKISTNATTLSLAYYTNASAILKRLHGSAGETFSLPLRSLQLPVKASHPARVVERTTNHQPEEGWRLIEIADTREKEPWKKAACSRQTGSRPAISPVSP